MIHYNENGLQASDFEHPADRAALGALRKIPAVDMLLGSYMDFLNKTGDFQQVSMDCFHVTENTYPRLYALYQKALDRLNMNVEPKLFLKLDYSYNGYTTGTNEPYIVINSASVEDSTDEEFLYLVGHELGHVKSGHVLYHGLVNMVLALVQSKVSIPAFLSNSLMIALFDWHRKSELTADRAGILAAGGADGPINYKLRTMGKTPKNQYVDFSPDKITQQVESFEAIKDSFSGKALYFLLFYSNTHPVTVERIREAKKWVQSEEYKRLIGRIQRVF